MIPLYRALPSRTSGYVIRPFVELKGQRYGYFWDTGHKGLWRAFLKSMKKNYTIKNTGKSFFIVLQKVIINNQSSVKNQR